MVSFSGGAISNIPIKKGTIFFVDLAICKLDFEPSKKIKHIGLVKTRIS